MSTETIRDRYISFDGLDCNGNATRVVETIRHYITNPGGSTQWAEGASPSFAHTYLVIC